MNRLKVALLLALVVSCLVGAGPVTAQEIPGGETPVVWIEKIVVSPSEILSEAEIASVVGLYEERHLTTAELSEALDGLNRLYLEKGFVTARAVLPPQTVEGGVVHIALVEGRVGEVGVEGNRYTQRDFIVQRMSLQPGDLVDVARLESDILFFNDVYDVQLVARLESGESFGTTNYILQAVEPRRWSTEISYSNSGRDETGANQLALTVVNRGLFGRSDPITFTLMGSDASAAGSFAYAMPLGASGGRLNLSYQTSRLEVVTGGFSEINVVGDSSGASVGWRQPVAILPGAKVFVTVDHRYLNTGTSLLGAKLADLTVRSTTYGIDAELADETRTLEVRQSVSKGVAMTEIGENEFVKYTGNLLRRWPWKERYALSFRVNGQLVGSGILPASEQFNLGGMGSVRGLAPGVSTGENGFAMSFEIRMPLGPALEGFAFVDHGAAFPDPVSGGRATSIGVGFDFRLFNHFSGSLVYGLPLGMQGSDLDQGRMHLRAAIGF